MRKEKEQRSVRGKPSGLSPKRKFRAKGHDEPLKGEGIFLIAIIAPLISFIFLFLSANSNPVSKIEDLARLSWELDKEITRSLSFKLAKEQPLMGTGEKYLLVDNQGNAWLFKLHEFPTSFYCKIEESVSRWGRMCGLNLPYVHRITLPVNGKIIEGTIQRMVPDAITLRGFDISKLTPSQISELLRQQVLDYFVDNYGSWDDNFLLSLKTRQIYGIDKDSSFDVDEKNIRENDSMRLFTGEGIYSDIWNGYIKGELEVDISSGLAVANLMSRISNKTVFEIFNPILDEPHRVTFGSIKTLQDKKNRLLEEFSRFYETVSQKRQAGLKMPDSNELSSYQGRVLKRLKDDIIDRQTRLKELGPKMSGQQEDIRVISSEDAWLLIEDKIFKPYLQRPLLNKQDYAAAITVLKRLRDSSKSIAERLAITIYILRVNELFLSGGDNFTDPFVLAKLRVTLHPQSVNIDSLKDRYSKIIGKGIFKEMEAESYYAMALSYLIQGRDEEAYRYALKAKNEGLRLDLTREKEQGER